MNNFATDVGLNGGLLPYQVEKSRIPAIAGVHKLAQENIAYIRVFVFKPRQVTVCQSAHFRAICLL